jgi:tetratricopeptide (TPR) repeat protein
MHYQAEMGKWVAILALTTALCMLFASVVAAADVPRPGRPNLLPPNVQEWALPMPGDTRQEGPADLGQKIWGILQLHHDRRHEAAIDAWNAVELRGNALIWKWIAVGQALTAAGEFEGAEEMLARAIDAQPENAIAHYFSGVLRMQQAYLADEWPDVITGKTTRLVAVADPDRAPRHVVPNTKGMYELVATREFEMAIEFAKHVRIDEALVPAEYAGTLALEPSVGDLLLALGADLYEAKAHNTLSYLFLERGALETAEHHMDEAVRGGMAVVYGYDDLGNEYTLRGQHADAARAYLKAAQYSTEKMSTLQNACRSILRALLAP